jgi:hypothetical protein
MKPRIDAVAHKRSGNLTDQPVYDRYLRDH